MIQAICWVLIHSLWQGLLFTIAAGLVMMYTKRLAAATRYIILSGLFFLFLGVCICTFFWELHVGTTGIDAGWKEGVEGLSAYCSKHASLIVLGWFIVVLAKSVRMITGVVYTQRMRHYGAVEAPVFWKEKIRGLCEELGIRKTVVLLESGVARMPMVIGHLKPVIFIPLGLLTRLPEGEIEAVLLHELAHIRRHDYFVNFLQHVAENLFFFNPGLLWISSLLREERENCCDDIAIARTNDKIALVRALISFKEHALLRKGLAMHFPSGKHQLLQRVLRITDNKNKTLNQGEKLFFLGSCLMISVILSFMHSPDLPAGDHLYTRRQGPMMADGTNQEAGKSGLVVVKDFWETKEVPQEQERPVAGKGRRGAAMDAEVLQFVAEKEQALRENMRMQVEENDKRDLQAKLEKEQSERVIQERDAEEELVRKNEEMMKNEEIMKMARAQAQRNKIQAEEGAREAIAMQVQAKLDQVQALKDQEQAQRDLAQALRDQEQARRDQIQASRDRVQALLDKEQAVKDRQQADLGKKLAAEDQLKAKKAEIEKDLKE